MNGVTAPAQAFAIGGFQPFSTVDWPDHLSATVFAQGCPWRCTYCHNPSLQDPRGPTPVTWDGVIEVLSTRTGLLDAVVFSGGEPTRQPALVPAMLQVKDLGYEVGLHTAGIYPARLATALEHVDWVGLDIKALPHRYGAITGVEAAGERAWAALDVVMRSGVDYEVRLTVDPTTHTHEDVMGVIDHLVARGVEQPVLQQARADGATADYAAALGGRTLASVIDPSEVGQAVIR